MTRVGKPPGLSGTGLCGASQAYRIQYTQPPHKHASQRLVCRGEKRFCRSTSSAPTVQIVRRMALLMGKELT